DLSPLAHRRRPLRRRRLPDAEARPDPGGRRRDPPLERRQPLHHVGRPDPRAGADLPVPPRDGGQRSAGAGADPHRHRDQLRPRGAPAHPRLPRRHGLRGGPGGGRRAAAGGGAGGGRQRGGAGAGARPGGGL
ncbi:MAG: Na(+) H(+) antiporter subunit C, partial [uncultured Thermomicrobiales bacterium]